MQVTFWTYAVCLGLLTGQTIRKLPVLVRVATAAYCRIRSTSLQPLAFTALALAIAQGFLYRPIFACLSACLAADTVYRFRKSPFASLARVAAASLTVTGTFALLPLRKEPSTPLVILPGAAAVCAVGISHAASLGLRLRPGGSERTGFVMDIFRSMRGGWGILWLQSGLTSVACACIVALQRPGLPLGEDSDGHSWQWLRWHAGALSERLNSVLLALFQHVTEWMTHVYWLQSVDMSPPQTLLWCCFFLSPALPLLTTPNTLPRLLSSLFGFLTLFMIMSISWEATFFACFCCTLIMYSLLMTAVSGRAGGMGQVSPLPPTARATDLSSTEMLDANGAEETLATKPEPPHNARLRETPARVAAHCSLHRDAAEEILEKGKRSPLRWRKRGSSSRGRSKTPSRRSSAEATKENTDANTADDPQDQLTGSVQTDEGLSMAEMWFAFALVFSMNLGFFGTGNMASVASFEPASVLRLMTCAAAHLTSAEPSRHLAEC